MIYWQLFSTFFEVGAFTFGGGYAMLPLIQQKVQAHHWISAKARPVRLPSIFRHISGR